MKRPFWIAVLVCCCCQVSADNAAPSVEETSPAAGPSQDLIYFGETGPVLLRLHFSRDGKALPAIWDDFVGKVFKHLDANGNGVLDKIEAQRMPPPDVLFHGTGGPNGSPAPAFRELDANGDGKVTRTELAAYFRRAGFGPFQLSASGPSSPWEVSAEVDYLIVNERNFDLSGVDFDIELQVPNRNRKPAGLDETLFKLLDTNGDGKLSKEELRAAPEVLLKRDRNEDEILTSDEIVSVNPSENRWQTPIYIASYHRPRGNSRPFWLVSAGESPLALAQVLLERYGGKDPKAREKGLTREHLGLDARSFAQLDVDGNGRLDLEELSRFARRQPDLELKIHLDQKPAVELVKRGTPLEKNVRAGRDGSLLLDLGGKRLDLKGLAAPKTDAAQSAKQAREQYLAQFKAADRDNNGYVDMSEAMRSPFFRNTFKQMDRDGDGMLFQKELLAFLDSFLDLQVAAHASCATVNLSQEGKGLFDLVDTNGDGRLTVREMHNAAKLLAELDPEGKGTLGRTDLSRHSLAVFSQGPAMTTILSRFDMGITPGQMPQPAPPQGPEWFRKMDRNGDGDVSRREFLGTGAQFKAIDTDGDGLISIQEAEAFEKRQKSGQK